MDEEVKKPKIKIACPVCGGNIRVCLTHWKPDQAVVIHHFDSDTNEFTTETDVYDAEDIDRVVICENDNSHHITKKIEEAAKTLVG